MSSDTSLQGKVVLVTGATGSLGRVVVKRLLENGAVVAAVYRDEGKYHELLDFVAGPRDPLVGVKADVTSDQDVRQAVEGVLRERGRIDALLNLVGGYRGGTDVAATSEEDWDFLMRLNVKSAFLCSRAVLPAMIKAGAGRVVCVAARPAIENKGRAKSAAYAASKAAVLVLTEAIAEETRKFGITANCLVPGTIDTPKNRAEIPGGDFSKWADPGAVAEVLLFLVSDASAVTSGAAIPVYGKS